jgi:hypothetical protein
LQLPQVNIAALEALKSSQERNNFVGNHIYGVIQQAYGDQNAPRITGMLLDENAVNFSQLLSDGEYFKNRIDEAYTLLMNSLNTNQQ